ncbi:hypothetical protein CPB85DRAFT_692213 [Mucidula mucida]|nr:hypothetical protein CPB85DRAFT_692213 [Mucidula mucida]
MASSSTTSTAAATTTESSGPGIDLVGGPFAVIESDPGVFTTLTRKLGVKGLEFVELYDIEPWAVDHLHPHGLIFCFLWRKDTHRPGTFDDPASERVWFANQLSDDACASQAILNVLFNCPDVKIGGEMAYFKEETKDMSPVMRGLAISNSTIIREAHNSLARPADIRGAINVIATTTLEAKKKKRSADPPPNKRAKTSEKPTKKEEETEDEVYHFIGYVPANGKVWELDGLKSGPLEVGEATTEWMNVVRPALRTKMRKYGHIQFSLLAIVDGAFETASDEWEYWKRERRVLERHLDAGWEGLVDPALRASAASLFQEDICPTYLENFGERRMRRDKEIIDMDQEQRRLAWEVCVKKGMAARDVVQQELTKAAEQNTEHIKRTHDYEPFFTEFFTRLNNEGHLAQLMKK